MPLQVRVQPQLEARPGFQPRGFGDEVMPNQPDEQRVEAKLADEILDREAVVRCNALEDARQRTDLDWVVVRDGLVMLAAQLRSHAHM